MDFLVFGCSDLAEGREERENKQINTPRPLAGYSEK